MSLDLEHHFLPGVLADRAAIERLEREIRENLDTFELETTHTSAG